MNPPLHDLHVAYHLLTAIDRNFLLCDGEFDDRASSRKQIARDNAQASLNCCSATSMSASRGHTASRRSLPTVTEHSNLEKHGERASVAITILNTEYTTKHLKTNTRKIARCYDTC